MRMARPPICTDFTEPRLVPEMTTVLGTPATGRGAMAGVMAVMVCASSPTGNK